MKVAMMLKYDIIDKKEFKAKLDLIKQEFKQRIQTYYDWMEILFTRGKLEDVEQKMRFLSYLWLEIKKLCVMKDYANMDVLFDVALKMEWVLVKLGKTPFELSKEEQEENMGII